MRVSKSIQTVCFLLVFGVTCLNSSAYAEPSETLSEFLEKIQQAAEDVQSYQSDFVQEKHLAMFKQPVLFSGSLAVARPDRLRWEFISPVSSALILNKNSGIRCSDGAEPVRFELDSDPVMKIVAKQLWQWLGGDYKALAKQYTLSLVEANTLQIVPQTKEGPIDFIRIRFDEELQPQEVIISEAGGDFTRIIFSAGKKNKELSAALFEQCEIDE